MHFRQQKSINKFSNDFLRLFISMPAKLHTSSFVSSQSLHSANSPIRKISSTRLAVLAQFTRETKMIWKFQTYLTSISFGGHCNFRILRQLDKSQKMTPILLFSLTQTHNRFTALLPGLPRWAGARRNLLLDHMVQEEISEVDTPTIQLGATPSGLISDPPPSSPYFHAECPYCHNP